MTPNLSILIKPGGQENRRGAPVRRLGFFLALLAIGLAILTSLSHSTSADFSSKGWSNSPQDSALRVMPQKSSGKSRLSEMNFRDNSSLKKLTPTGGTNINDALRAGLKQFDSSDRPKLLVFMTDGLPTVGTTNVTQIVDNVRKASKPGVRLFTFGVGYNVNRTELRFASLR